MNRTTSIYESLKLTKPPSLNHLLDFSAYQPYPSLPPPSINSQLYTALLHPAVPLTIATIYATTVHYLNSCANGTPYRISKTSGFRYAVIFHNMFLAVYSLWTFIGMVGALNRSFFQQAVWHDQGVVGIIDSLCKIQDRHQQFYYDGDAYDTTSGLLERARSGLWSEGLAYYGFWFYLSKFYEVFDTLIILAKGRKSSTLQTYHHTGAMISMWAGMRWMSPPIWLFCFFNSAIHTLMYTYYTLSALRIRVPAIVKRTLTTMQITQFLIGGSAAAAYLFVKYRTHQEPGSIGEWQNCLSNRAEEWAVVINVSYLTPLTYLFVRFFIQSYLVGGKGTRGAISTLKNNTVTAATNGNISKPINNKKRVSAVKIN